MYDVLSCVSYVLLNIKGFIICKRGISVCQQCLDIFVLAISFRNISKDLNFKPDDNCMSPFGQAPR